MITSSRRGYYLDLSKPRCSRHSLIGIKLPLVLLRSPEGGLCIMYRLATISASDLLGFCVNFLFDFWFLYHSRRRGFGYFQHFHWLGQLVGRTKSPMGDRGTSIGTQDLGHVIHQNTTQTWWGKTKGRLKIAAHAARTGILLWMIF